jgi:hypothetical protein
MSKADESHQRKEERFQTKEFKMASTADAERSAGTAHVQEKIQGERDEFGDYTTTSVKSKEQTIKVQRLVSDLELM